MNIKKTSVFKAIILSVILIFVVSPVFCFIINELVISDRFTIKIDNASKSETHAVILHWPNGEQEYTVYPGKTVTFKIKDIGENSILLYVKKTGKTYAVTGYITSKPFGNIEVVLDSQGFMRSYSWTKNFFFEKPTIHKCDRTSCLFEIPNKEDL